MIQITMPNSQWTRITDSHDIFDPKDFFYSGMGVSYWGNLYMPRSQSDGSNYVTYPDQMSYNIAIQHPITTVLKQGVLSIPKLTLKLPRYPYVGYSVGPGRITAIRTIIQTEPDAMCAYNNIKGSLETARVAILILNQTSEVWTRDAQNILTKTLGESVYISTEQTFIYYGGTNTTLTIANGTIYSTFWKAFEQESNRTYPIWNPTLNPSLDIGKQGGWDSVILTNPLDPVFNVFRSIAMSQGLYGITMVGIPNEYCFSDVFHPTQGHGLSKDIIEQYIYSSAGLSAQYVSGEFSEDDTHILPAGVILPGGAFNEHFIRKNGGFLLINVVKCINGVSEHPAVLTDLFVGPYGELQIGGCFAPLQTADTDGLPFSQYDTTTTASGVSYVEYTSPWLMLEAKPDTVVIPVTNTVVPETKQARILLTDDRGNMLLSTITKAVNTNGIRAAKYSVLAEDGNLRVKYSSIAKTKPNKNVVGALLSPLGWKVGNISAIHPYTFSLTTYRNVSTGDRWGGQNMNAAILTRHIWDACTLYAPTIVADWKAAGFTTYQVLAKELVSRHLIGIVDFQVGFTPLTSEVVTINYNW